MEDDDEYSSTPSFRYRWDVFLSFRGEDTRPTFTESLYRELISNGIRTFRDDEDLRRGEEIAPSLLEAIQDTAAAIAVISKRYASSRWCLEELATIMDCRKLVLPVFYQVDPSDVRRQMGPFKEDFVQLEKRFGEEKVRRWRRALQKAGEISGWDSKNREDQEIIQSLVKEVLSKLSNTPLGAAKYPVGLNSRLQELMGIIDVKANGVRVLGLYGMGGAGKTTLGKALYNKLVIHFKHRSFVPNVRETWSQQNGFVELQKKLIADFSPNAEHVNDSSRNMLKIKELIHENPVLVFLDDVDDVRQLDVLAGQRNWFCEGSRIIITTRDKEILVGSIVNTFYEVKELNAAESLQLFSYHAFGREKPAKDFVVISAKIVFLTGGLPLALEVFGSFLFDKRRKIDWEDALQKLKEIRPRNLQDVLLISFNGLDEEEKCVFLDIACFFANMWMKREYAIDILKGCGFRAEIVMAVLTAKSLVRVVGDNILWMHDQLRDMGRQIVQEENLADPGQRSRLWNDDDIMKVLKNKTGTRNIQGIALRTKKGSSSQQSYWKNFKTRPSFASAVAYLKEVYMNYFHIAEISGKDLMLHASSFKPMAALRLLQINYVKLKGSFRCMPAELKWLQWKGCSMRIVPLEFFTQHIAVLDLSESEITEVPELGWWNWYTGNKIAEKLLVLDLHKCSYLKKIPDFSVLSILEKMNLENCVALVEIPNSIGKLNRLRYLNLKNCSMLVRLPSDVSGLKNLESLILSGCSSLKELPKDMSCMVSLRELLVDWTEITEVPESIVSLKKLEMFSLKDCRSLKRLPDDFEKLSSLEFLNLGNNNFCSLPSSLRGLSFLKKLLLPNCQELKSLPPLPSSLDEVDVANCFALESIYDLSNLESLKLFNLTNCEKVMDIPGLECLKSLRWLYMSGCKACSSVVKRRLSKVHLKKLLNVSMPGSKIPEWFSPDIVRYSKHKNLEIKGVIIGVVVSINHQIPDDLRYEIPSIVDIKAKIITPDRTIFNTILNLRGVPKTNEDQVHLCRYPADNRLVSLLKDGYEVQVTKHDPAYIQGVELKKCGIYLVFENDDDYDGDEESLDESQLSVSEKLKNFFGSFEEDGKISEQGYQVEEKTQEIKGKEGTNWGYFPFVSISFTVSILLISCIFSWSHAPWCKKANE